MLVDLGLTQPSPNQRPLCDPEQATVPLRAQFSICKMAGLCRLRSMSVWAEAWSDRAAAVVAAKSYLDRAGATSRFAGPTACMAGVSGKSSGDASRGIKTDYI